MSSLQKKKDCKFYYAVIDYINDQGKKKQKWISTRCTLKTEAKKVLVDLEYKMHHGIVIPSNILFTKFLCDWLENVISKQVEQTTLDGYTTNIKTHIVPYFQPMQLKLKELKTIHLQQYFDFKYEQGRVDGKGGLSAKYLKKHYVNLKKALDYAVKMELIERNPVVNVSLPSIEPYEAKYLTVEQAQTLLEAVKGTNIETAVYLTINYGLRRGEVLGLRWSDIEFEKNILTIKNTRTKVTKAVEKKPKTEASQRQLFLIPKVSDYLKKLKKKQLEDQLFLGGQYNINDYVCRYEDGTPLNIVTLNQCI